MAREGEAAARVTAAKAAVAEEGAARAVGAAVGWEVAAVAREGEGAARAAAAVEGAARAAVAAVGWVVAAVARGLRAAATQTRADNSA